MLQHEPITGDLTNSLLLGYSCTRHLGVRQQGVDQYIKQHESILHNHTLYEEFSVELPIPNSSMFVLPMITAPAARSFATTVALKGGR